MAFIIAAIVACLAVAVVEDILYFATGVPFWSTGFHPVSIFAGSAVFLGLLYFLQRMHDPRHALQYNTLSRTFLFWSLQALTLF